MTFRPESLFVNAGFVGLLVTIAMAGTLAADVVYLKDGSALFGRIESKDQRVIRFQQRIPESTQYRQRTIRLDEVLTSVKTIDESRLVALNPERPDSYRELADQVSVQRKDPEARDLAVRLYLLAAWLGQKQAPQAFKEHCFRQLIMLARSEREAKRFRVLAHVATDGQSDWLINESQLPTTEVPSGENPKTPSQQEQKQQLLQAIRMIRDGQSEKASPIINEPWAATALQPYAATCDWFGLREIIASSELPVDKLAKLVELEVLLSLPADANVDAKSSELGNPHDWSQIIGAEKRSGKQSTKLSAAYSIRFENVCEFDMTMTVFRNGRWEKP